MNKKTQAILDSMTIIVDTREQDTAIFDWLQRKNKNVVIKKLDYADFSFYVPKNEELGIMEDVYFDKEIVIERKANFDEIIGNICEGDRFERELMNCPAKMTLLIQDKYDNACLANYRSNFDRKALLGKLASITHKYNVPCVYLSKESSPVFIYTHFYYYLRNKLIKGEF